jgi:serine protease Do
LPPGLEQYFRRFFHRPFGQEGNGDSENAPAPRVQAVGSGFIVDPSGYVVTNNHAIDGADKVTVILEDGTQYPAEVKGRDPKTDLALLKVKPKNPLPYVTFGDSDKTRVGDWVVAIGNPLGAALLGRWKTVRQPPAGGGWRSVMHGCAAMPALCRSPRTARGRRWRRVSAA